MDIECPVDKERSESPVPTNSSTTVVLKRVLEFFSFPKPEYTDIRSYSPKSGLTCTHESLQWSLDGEVGRVVGWSETETEPESVKRETPTG